jgi:glycosyltransferase involved in cell wall biosynthesis
MAAGTPVVAFEDPALRETLAGCGRLVSPGDSAALASAIAAVLDDDAERERMVRCGHTRAGTLGLDAAVGRLAAVYEELLPA